MYINQSLLQTDNPAPTELNHLS